MEAQQGWVRHPKSRGPHQPGGGRWLPAGLTQRSWGTNGAWEAGGTQSSLCGVYQPGTHLPPRWAEGAWQRKPRLCPRGPRCSLGEASLLQPGDRAAGWGRTQPQLCGESLAKALAPLGLSFPTCKGCFSRTVSFSLTWVGAGGAGATG